MTADKKAGGLTAEVAARVGLPPGVAVAVGAFDAHMGAVGAGIKPGTLVKIIGTSTCDMMVAPMDKRLPDIPGLCGIVPGSVLPDMYGLEAGQSAVGDIFNWFVKLLTAGPCKENWFVKSLAPAQYAGDGDAHVELTRAAEKLLPGESGLVALDWNNGNRTVLVDPLLTGLLVGQTLHTTAAEIYRALIEATAFGALAIIDRFEEYGVKVKEVVNCGGIAEKNPLVMQIYADVCNRPMKVSRSAQTMRLRGRDLRRRGGRGLPQREGGTEENDRRPRRGLSAWKEGGCHLCRAVPRLRRALQCLQRRGRQVAAQYGDEGPDCHPRPRAAGSPLTGNPKYQTRNPKQIGSMKNE